MGRMMQHEEKHSVLVTGPFQNFRLDRNDQQLSNCEWPQFT